MKIYVFVHFVFILSTIHDKAKLKYNEKKSKIQIVQITLRTGIWPSEEKIYLLRRACSVWRRGALEPMLKPPATHIVTLTCDARH
jgi:hypothetical protein